MLEILSPEKTLFHGEVKCVKLNGGKSPFMVLHNHAPIVTTLTKGCIRWENETGSNEVAIVGGFAKVQNNNVTLCVETDK